MPDYTVLLTVLIGRSMHAEALTLLVQNAAVKYDTKYQTNEQKNNKRKSEVFSLSLTLSSIYMRMRHDVRVSLLQSHSSIVMHRSPFNKQRIHANQPYTLLLPSKLASDSFRFSIPSARQHPPLIIPERALSHLI